jgi:hypothetical protein
MEYTGNEMMGVLQVVHKYCMDVIEKDITKSLAVDTSFAGLVNLLVASRVVDDKELHQKAWDGLLASTENPDLEQARRMGPDILHALLLARRPPAGCRHCSNKSLYCGNCGNYQ